MATVKQLELNVKRANDKIVKLTKELAGQKALKVKLGEALKKAKASLPKKAVKKNKSKKKK
jgi:hypothetical protein